MAPPAKSPLTFSITSTIKNIPLKDWDRLFGEDIIEGYGYHKTIEEAGMKEFSLRYLLASRGDRLVAIIPFFIMDFSFASIIQGPLQKLILSIQKILKNALKMRLLFIGFPTTEEIYLGVSEDEDFGALLDEALKRLHGISKKERAGVILFYNLTERDSQLAKLLVKRRFARMESFPNTLLEICSDSLDEYIKKLGKNTRKDLRRKLRESSSIAQLKTEIRDDIKNVEKDIYRLYLNNLANSNVSFETLTPEFFRRISDNMHGVTKFFLTWDQNRLVAFDLCLVKGDTCIDKFVGFDKEVAFDYHLYYVTFCNNIEWCMKNGVRHYQLGITDYDPKVRLGAKLISLCAYIKFRNPALNLMAGFITKLLEPKNFDPALKKLSGF